MAEYRVEIMAGESVVSSQVLMAQAPFKAAEAHVGQPVTLRHQEENWVRVCETRGGRRTFAYVRRMRAAETTRGRKLFGQAAEQVCQVWPG